jgi:hypothetical protein
MDYPKSGPATLDDLRRVLGISRARAAAAVERGELPARKIGGKYYSRFEWIRTFCETGTWNPAQIERPATGTRPDEI